MQSKSNEYLIAWLALLSGLSISAVAVYYSVVGLTAIFAAAVVPIIIMGTILEISKLVATVWLKQNWSVAPTLIKIYLFVAVIVLMIITSLGIFGFLSKAHLDQGVPTGDVAAQVALIDEKIKTEKENIDSARKALVQMDATVDQTISRSTNEQGATRAAQLRRSQQKERIQLQSDISSAQKKIAALNEERAPIAKDLRKVEAEVGPIKYIAAFFYGETDHAVLDKAVTWVIIILIVVFDPLAVILLLASQYSFQKLREEVPTVDTVPEELPKYTPPEIINEVEVDDNPLPEEEPVVTAYDIENHTYLKKPWVPIPTVPREVPKAVEVAPVVEEAASIVNLEIPAKTTTYDWSTVPKEQEYVVIDGQHMSVKAAKSLYPQTPAASVYVQNEEQLESGRWKDITTSTQISEKDYFSKAEQNNAG
jgi:hypothetical protein